MQNSNEKKILTSENNSKDISSNDGSFESTLKSLEAETFALEGVLNNTSDTIRQLEKSLIGSKTNFVYKKKILTENKSNLKAPEDRHLEEAILDIQNYYTEIWWFLSWEPDETSKSYRLFLISEEKEFCWQHIGQPTRNCGKEIEFKSTIIFQKPLIESKLEVRLRFSQYIIPFMNSFKEALKKYRVSLNNDKNFSYKEESSEYDCDMRYIKKPTPLPYKSSLKKTLDEDDLPF